MRKKLIEVLPFLPVWQKIFTSEIIFVSISGFFIYLSQPAIDNKETLKKSGADKMSALGIVTSFLVMFLVPTLDFGYFQKNCTSSCLTMKIIGVALVVGGLAFRYWAIQTLGNFFTSTVKIQDDHRLVENGPYKWLRHPSYTGAFDTAMGVPLVLTSWIGFAAIRDSLNHA